jgi:hypothetical protein
MQEEMRVVQEIDENLKPKPEDLLRSEDPVAKAHE